MRWRHGKDGASKGDGLQDGKTPPMPIFKSDTQLIYYAHVPKCGGTSVAWYLQNRFGEVAFSDKGFNKRPVGVRWTKSSPQHVDVAALTQLFPPDFFDAVFTIVRHPVPRLISAYHFQREVEKSIPADTGFGSWLRDIPARRAADAFAQDNHIRPMAEIVPEGAKVFHMEHGLDALIPWLDAVTGVEDGLRAIPEINRKGEYTGEATERVRPSAEDLAEIGRLYAVDFERFGYDPAQVGPPDRPAPEVSDSFAAARDRARARMDRPLWRLRRKIAAKLVS